MSKIVTFPSERCKAGPSLNSSAITETSRTKAIARAPGAEAVELAIAGTADGKDLGPVLDVSQLVALVLRTCRRLGHKPSRLSPILAADLERHCVLGDPTARLLRDWLANKSVRPLVIPDAIAAAEPVAVLAGEG